MLKLDKKEKETVNKLLSSWGYFDETNDIEEDCCGTRSYHFEVLQSGIGDLIYLCYKNNRELISDIDSF